MSKLVCVLSGCEKDAKKLYSELVGSAKSLLQHCEGEIHEMKLCGDCYMKREQEDFFIKVCSQPHLVLWVKYHTYPYWPAKLLKVHDKRGKPLEVYFFKDHNTALVSHDNCFLYSKEDPNIYCTDQDKANVTSAVEVRNINIFYFKQSIHSFYNLGGQQIHPECGRKIWKVSFCKRIQKTNFG